MIDLSAQLNYNGLGTRSCPLQSSPSKSRADASEGYIKLVSRLLGSPLLFLIRHTVAESLLTWAAWGVIGEDGKRDSYLQITRWNIEDSQKPSVSSPRSQSSSGAHGRHYYTAATRYKRRIKNATVFLTFAAPDAH